jgi:hypothetical protein
MWYRHPNPRLAKIHRSHSVEDISRLFDVHKNTVRTWLRAGLKPVDDQRPALVRGEELCRFLTNLRARAKQVCGLGRIYCLPCREPKVPAGKMAECIESRNTGMLQAICPDCNRMICRKVNPKKLEATFECARFSGLVRIERPSEELPRQGPLLVFATRVAA